LDIHSHQLQTSTTAEGTFDLEIRLHPRDQLVFLRLILFDPLYFSVSFAW
jgi:hypothetical protein